MSRILVSLVILISTLSINAIAAQPKMLGNLQATSYQICGKGIEIQIAEMSGEQSGRLVLGLKNNTTGETDLFTSPQLTATNKYYDQYLPVLFDNLSKTFVATPGGKPSIVWGAAFTNLKGMTYSLALGSHVYSCNAIQPFKNDLANRLYGEGPGPSAP